MTLRYIFHSGFLLETEQSILIFDYWMDPANVVESFIYPSGSKHVYVFASHFHEDHFNKDIFKWRQNNPFSDYTYILSKDILKRKRAQKEDADVWMAKGSVWEDENIKVMSKETQEHQLTEYEDYCRMMAQQQEDEMDETIMEDELKEYQPEGIFVRGH